MTERTRKGRSGTKIRLTEPRANFPCLAPRRYYSVIGPRTAGANYNYNVDLALIWPTLCLYRFDVQLHATRSRLRLPHAPLGGGRACRRRHLGTALVSCRPPKYGIRAVSAKRCVSPRTRGIARGLRTVVRPAVRERTHRQRTRRELK